MDKAKETDDIVKNVNRYQTGDLSIEDLISSVCSYFDVLKNTPLTDADKQFLYFLSNLIGIPQYYDTLQNSFGKDMSLQSIGLDTIALAMQESCLCLDSERKIHRYQKEILAHFQNGECNRYFLTAATSFGKTFLVYEILRKMQYRNVFLIFPTIALLSENLEKILSSSEFEWIRNKYKIHSLTNIQELGDCNMFLYTPERYLSYTDNPKCQIADFVFVDEAYKLDNDYLIDEESQENDRDVAYRLCINQALQTDTDMLLAGPFIERCSNQGNSFELFLEENHIEWLNYNEYKIVGKHRYEIKDEIEYKIENHCFHFAKNLSLEDKIIEIVKTLLADGENVIVYCSRKSRTEKLASKLVSGGAINDIVNPDLSRFQSHLKNLFLGSEDWIVTKALSKGIGVHHGLVPKYIQKEIISLFNRGVLKVLFVTTTITEGVNTTAKNVIITSAKKGCKNLKPFDALNIEGRAGRFLKHYAGNVIIVDSNYGQMSREYDVDPIKHKNYDINSPKQDVDLYYTMDKYLVRKDIETRQLLDEKQRDLGIPDDVMTQYKVVSKSLKLQMYQIISGWSPKDLNLVVSVYKSFAITHSIIIDDFEVIVQAVKEIVPQNTALYRYMNHTFRNSPYSIFSVFTNMYLKNGLYKGISYYVRKGEKVDDVVRRQTNFVFNVLRYQAVKYLGVFNLMYKCYMGNITGQPWQDVKGIDNILMALEYNARTTQGMIAMDYGVPLKVVECLDAEGASQQKVIIQSMDEYEKTMLIKVNKILSVNTSHR